MTNDLNAAEQTIEKVAVGIADTVAKAHALRFQLAFPKDPHDETAMREATANYAEADRLLSELHRAWTYGETQRVEFTKPLNEVIRKINGVFKARLDPVAEIKDSLRLAMSAYGRAELAWKRAEEERKRKEEIKRREDEQLKKAEAAAAMGLNGTADKILEKPIAAPRVEVEGATDRARSSNTVKWTARIVNKVAFIRAVAEGQIDPEYISIDEPAVRKAAAALKSAMKWPGVEVFEDVQVGSRR